MAKESIIGGIMSMISRWESQSLYLSAILAAFSLVSMFAFVSVVASGADHGV